MPAGPDRTSVRRDVERMVETVLAVFRRYGVPIEARREIGDLMAGRRRALEAG